MQNRQNKVKNSRQYQIGLKPGDVFVMAYFEILEAMKLRFLARERDHCVGTLEGSFCLDLVGLG